MLFLLKMFFFLSHRNHVDGIHWFCANFDQATSHVPSMEWCSFLQIIEICLLIRHEPTTALGMKRAPNDYHPILPPFTSIVFRGL